MSFATLAYCGLVVSILSFIFIVIYENLQWQMRMLKWFNALPLPKKPKLKKGQKIVFQEKDNNPFEEENADSKPNK